MLIRINPLNKAVESLEEEVFIPQERIDAIRKIKTDWNGAIVYQIDASGYVYVIDKNAYEKIVNFTSVFDSEAGDFKWNFFEKMNENG